MKLHMVLQLDRTRGFEAIDGIEPLDKDRCTELGEAFLDAYMDTIDYEGEDLEDAIHEVKHVLANGYGRFSEKHSGAIHKDNSIASAVFAVHEGDTIFIPYLITTKKESGKGHARRLMKHCINKAIESHASSVELYVTEGNHRAERLYETLGFRKVQ